MSVFSSWQQAGTTGRSSALLRRSACWQRSRRLGNFFIPLFRSLPTNTSRQLPRKKWGRKWVKASQLRTQQPARIRAGRYQKRRGKIIKKSPEPSARLDVGGRCGGRVQNLEHFEMAGREMRSEIQKQTWRHFLLATQAMPLARSQLSPPLVVMCSKLCSKQIKVT